MFLVDELIISQEKNSVVLTKHRYHQICLCAQWLSAVVLSWMFSNTLFYLEILVLIISELHLLHLSKQIHCFPNRNPSTGCSGTRHFLVLLSFFQYKSLKFYSKQPRLGLISVGCCCSGKKKREREREREIEINVCLFNNRAKEKRTRLQTAGGAFNLESNQSISCLP